MTVWNTGFIEFDRPLNDLAVQTLQDEWHGYWDDYNVGEMEWSIDNDLGADFDDDIQEMIDLLSPLGYVLNGEVQYYGDYEGKIYVENNKITLRSIEDTGLYEASDAELIQMLNERGYDVIKVGRR